MEQLASGPISLGDTGKYNMVYIQNGIYTKWYKMVYIQNGI